MHFQPYTDTAAFSIDDSNDEEWTFGALSFEPLRVNQFKAPSGGRVRAATINPATMAMWVLSHGQLYAASHQKQIAVPLPLPATDTVAFDVVLLGSRYYLPCNDATVWYYEREKEDWFMALQPPTEGHSAPGSFERAQQRPDLYRAFAVGDAHYFAGALGLVACVRGDSPATQLRLREEPILVDGHAEGGQAILCGSGKRGVIYRGTIDTGFEVLFESDDPSLNLTALHKTTRYLGVNVLDAEEGPGLFALRDGKVESVRTGCNREPGPLQKLVCTGEVLWAIDELGCFRLTDSGWQLHEFEELVPRD